MTQEDKKATLAEPNAQDTSQVLDKPIEEAAVVASELDQENNGTEGLAADQAIEQIAGSDEEIAAPDQAAVPAAEAVPAIVSPELSSHVIPSGDQAHTEIAHQGIAPTGAQAAGEHHPVAAVDGSQVTIQQGTKDIIFPPVMSTGQFANGDTAPLEQAVQRRWRILKFPKLPKILGGTKAA